MVHDRTTTRISREPLPKKEMCMSLYLRHVGPHQPKVAGTTPSNQVIMTLHNHKRIPIQSDRPIPSEMLLPSTTLLLFNPGVESLKESALSHVKYCLQKLGALLKIYLKYISTISGKIIRYLTGYTAQEKKASTTMM